MEVIKIDQAVTGISQSAVTKQEGNAWRGASRADGPRVQSEMADLSVEIGSWAMAGGHGEGSPSPGAQGGLLLRASCVGLDATPGTPRQHAITHGGKMGHG